MSKLLDVYNSMVKEAEETQAQDQEKEVLAAYASTADQMLAAEYGDDYTEEDVEKLASMMIENDAQVEEDQEKVAEWDAQGRVMAIAFLDELNKAE